MLNALTTDAQTCIFARYRAFGLLRRRAMFGLLSLGSVYRYSSLFFGVRQRPRLPSVRPKIEGVGVKTPPLQKVKVAPPCYNGEFCGLVRSKLVFRRNMFFRVSDDFNTFGHILSYTKFFRILYETCWTCCTPFWAAGPSLILYTSAVSADIRTIFSRTVDMLVVSQSNGQHLPYGFRGRSYKAANLTFFRNFPICAILANFGVP